MFPRSAQVIPSNLFLSHEVLCVWCLHIEEEMAKKHFEPGEFFPSVKLVVFHAAVLDGGS